MLHIGKYTKISASNLCRPLIFIMNEVSQKKFMHFGDYEIKDMRLIFKTEMFIQQSKANLYRCENFVS